jgi:hypothetical protein
MGHSESGSIVDAVAGHCHDLSAAFEFLNLCLFISRADLRE